MEITTESFKRCDMVKVEGRIDSQTAPQLAEAMEAITDAGRYKIVVDMSEVGFISSAGLRVLINAQKTCNQLNRGEVILAAVPERIYEIFDLAGLLPIFRFEDDVLHAIGNC
ncbi:MAG: STAS domain-containing protein [Anaerolineae bacterium]